MDLRHLVTQAVRWREIGPPRGGRVVAVAGHPTQRSTFYFGACGGGVWKTTDGGNSWQNTSDGYLASSPVGALAVAASDPSVIYAGMGESCVRGNVISGDGVYRSTDDGRTWSHLGLERTRHISRVRVHPENADVVYVAALGDIFGPDPARGVYRSTNGGRDWALILEGRGPAGAADLVMDPSNPRILFASLWEITRTPWNLTSGGAGSGLFRSTDGGDTWTEISVRRGFPAGLLGRIGVAVAPTRPGRVWALVEAAGDAGGVYISEDYGDTWSQLNSSKAVRGRPFYYSHLVADPADHDTLWCPNLVLWKSTDAGRTYAHVPSPHADTHDIWIDPSDPDRLILGTDGGASVSFDGGRTFSTNYNQNTAQIYHLDVDDATPYNVYGTQQDNTAIFVPSRARRGYIAWEDCDVLAPCECGDIAVDPRHPDVQYVGSFAFDAGGGGALYRFDRRTEQMQLVTVRPEMVTNEHLDADVPRFQWTYPIVFSPHDPACLYVGSNYVYRSRDDGLSWEPISPDLTRADHAKLAPSGGLTSDNSGVEIYGTVFALAESPLAAGLIWAGTDDGRVHVTSDGGASWTDVTPPGLGEWSTVGTIEPSRTDARAAYLAAHRYRLGDRAPYLFKTVDMGATWTTITAGIGAEDFLRVVRADPAAPGLLFAGAETGLYVSFTDGAQWQRVGSNFPVVPVHDMKAKDDALVVATHGRGFWILDDLTPYREAAANAQADGVHLFGVAPFVRYASAGGPPGAGGYEALVGGWWKGLPPPAGARQSLSQSAVGLYHLEVPDDGPPRAVLHGAGSNPPTGVEFGYVLPDPVPPHPIELEIRTATGERLVTFTSRKPEAAGAGNAGIEVPQAITERALESLDRDAALAPGWLPRRPGLNHFVWPVQAEGGRPIARDDETPEPPALGPVVPPGTYTAVLRAGDAERTTTFEVRADPRSTSSPEDWAAGYAFARSHAELQTRVNLAVGRVLRISADLDRWKKRLNDDDPAASAIDSARARATDILRVLHNPEISSELGHIQYASALNNKVDALGVVVQMNAGYRPTAGMVEAYERLSARADAALADVEAFVTTEVAAANRAIADRNRPAIDAGV